MTFDSDRIEIRPLDGSDLEQILAIAETIEEAPRWSPAQYEELLPVEGPLPGETRRSRIALVAGNARAGEMLGFVFASLVPPEAELESIVVAPNAQRQGIGQRLLARLVAELRAARIRELHLEVRASNRTALAFYLAQRFRQSGVRPRYYTDPEEDAILMTLRLSAPGEP